MKNILYIGDPNSIHDRKWMAWFAEQNEYNCFLLNREIHGPGPELKNITKLGAISDYSVFKPWKNGSSAKKIREIISQYQIDIVHIFYAEPNLLWANQLPNSVRVILTTRGSDILIGMRSFIESNKWKDRIIMKRYANALKKCDAIISTSSKQQDFINQHFSTDLPLHMIRTGINMSRIIPKSETQNIVFFPRLMEPLYNHELALSAIRNLPQNIQDHCLFVFIGLNGKNTDYITRIKSIIDRTQGVNISFLPLLQEKEYFEVLSKSKVVVMTPDSDGSPVSGMEALAAGSQLVLPNLGYDEDLFANAYFFEPKNANDLSLAIIQAIEKPKPTASEDYKIRVDQENEMNKVKQIYNQSNNSIRGEN